MFDTKFFNNKAKTKNELKRNLIESIQRDVECLDLLENLLSLYENNYKFSEKREDEIMVEKVKWIIIQIEYNVKIFKDTLKKNGGNPNAIQPFEWK